MVQDSDKSYRQLQKGCGICISICAPEALRLDKRDESIFMPAANAEELLVMRGESTGRPYPVHHHQPVENAAREESHWFPDSGIVTR